ncbi:hypothetical protein GGX14DRAFT_480183 [Mycena pura]|uniref:Uncharacterized protein n=1 Tax=Mycena pura TaxID=153505 RepID=A0AAD6URV0_9AGAR|nr:hypothetical protein GGX14DRAFT_480183 [Mycena pura]
MFAISPLVLLLAASLVSAASTPVARGTFPVCAICPSVDTAGNAVGANAGFGLTPPERFCGYGDEGANGFITRCFYDNSGALTMGTVFCPPGPIPVNTPPNCQVVTA